MSAIVVDSSVWIDNSRRFDTPATNTLKRIVAGEIVLVGDVVLLEVLQGAKTEHEAANLERFLRRFKIVEMMDESLAIQTAANYRLLRRRGITIRKTADIIIGTYCIEHGHPLLQSDRDFLPMAEHLGLKLV